MSELILEGVWEEIMQRADELAGSRVRVIVLEDSIERNGNEARMEERPLAEMLSGLIGVIDSRTPAPPFPHKQSAWGEAVEEKFRKQRLQIP